MTTCVHVFHTAKHRKHLQDFDGTPGKLRFDGCAHFHSVDPLSSFQHMIAADVVLGSESSFFYMVLVYMRGIAVVAQPNHARTYQTMPLQLDVNLGRPCAKAKPRRTGCPPQSPDFNSTAFAHLLRCYRDIWLQSVRASRAGPRAIHKGGA